MLVLKIYFWSLLFANPINFIQKTITVIGKAENDKGEAYVSAMSGKRNYYVAGIHSWDQKTIGRTVKVTGQVLVRYSAPQKEGEELKQMMVGKKYIILNPKWELVK